MQCYEFAVKTHLGTEIDTVDGKIVEDQWSSYVGIVTLISTAFSVFGATQHA